MNLMKNCLARLLFHLCNLFEGLKFQEIKDVEVWHETVCLFSVTDVSSSELLGYFYLDIFSRLVFCHSDS